MSSDGELSKGRAFQKKPAYSVLNILQARQTFQAARAVCKLIYPIKSSSWPPLNEIWTILDPHLSASHTKFKLQTVHVHKPSTKAALGHMAGPTAMSRGNWTAFNPEIYPNQNPAFKYARGCFCSESLLFLHEKNKQEYTYVMFRYIH